jgi:hypothetical protein
MVARGEQVPPRAACALARRAGWWGAALPFLVLLLCSVALAAPGAPLSGAGWAARTARYVCRLRGGDSAESDVERSDSFLELLPQPRGTCPPERPQIPIELAGRDSVPGVGDESSAPEGRMGKRRHLPLDKWVEDGLGDEENNYEGVPCACARYTQAFEC